MPRNTSISMTLDACKSITSFEWKPLKTKKNELQVSFFHNGVANPDFAQKTLHFLKENLYLMPFLRQFDLTISTENTFPHAAGIASSASGMSAISMCLTDMANALGEPVLAGGNDDIQNASIIARLGSGSACRSLYSGAAIWGHHPQIENSSDQYAIGMGENLNRVFKAYKDAIVIVSDREKKVSSSAGHGLMVNNPFADIRYNIAQQNALKVYQTLQFGDLKTFGEIMEEEALMLHALMMTSHPSYLLLNGNTIRVIEAVRNFRADTKLPVYFTLDAGPNVHILYPDTCNVQVNEFLKTEFGDEFRIIFDHVGQGPEKLA